MNIVLLKVNPVRELREYCSVRFWEIGLQSWHISQKIGWVPTFHGGGTHWVFVATPWFFACTQLDWRSIKWESYVNPVQCVFCEIGLQSWHISQKFGWFVLAVLIEFSLRHPGSLHEHRLTEGQSTERVTWILSSAFLRNWLTKLAISKSNGWVPTFRGGGTHWVFLATPWFFANTVWLKVWESYVNPTVRAWQLAYFQKTMAELSFPCNTLVLSLNTVCLKVNPVRELRESCPLRFLRN